MEHDIASPALSGDGARRIAWAESEMPVLRGIRETFARERPLDGVRIGACLHVTTETGALVRTLIAGGARVALCASNPLSTQDDVAAALVDEGVPVFARRGEDGDTYYRHVAAVLATNPQVTLDDGADLITMAHRNGALREIVGGTEETTTGVVRLRAMARERVLKVPVVAVNDADTKHLFDNRYGTGQSTIDGILRATNFLLAGRTFVVAGYGWCGRGIARRAQGMGAHVVVTEIDPVKAIEAVMDGFEVAPMREVIGRADVVVTATGDRDVVAREHLLAAKDGVLLANSGHFDVEVNVADLRGLSVEVRHPRPEVEEHVLPDGRRLRLLAEGRLVNLAAAEGHPAAVMDMSFANQALVAAWLWRVRGTLPVAVHRVPADIDAEVAARKLAAMGVRIDVLTPEQRAYLDSWREGT